jgi:hypothetical protein
MHRDRVTTVAERLAEVERLMREGLGLRLLLARLPAGATLDDARRLRARLLQQDRRPSPLLDGALGIRRGSGSGAG